jgi:protein tyrosine phosphatase
MKAISNYVYTDNGAEVHDGIFIGSLATGKNDKWISDNAIDIIINMSGYMYNSNVPVVVITIDDNYVPISEINSYMEKLSDAAKYIKKYHSRGKRILVHCAAGINRSAAAICLYLMMIGHRYDDALDKLTSANSKRNLSALTNVSFRYLLCTYSACKECKCL